MVCIPAILLLTTKRTEIMKCCLLEQSIFFLFINQNLTDAAMSRALMLCGESKAAAVSQLLLGSCYSEEIATGSGTDGIVIASNLCGTRTLTDASGHSKLGELIGKSVKSAVKQALLKQNSGFWPEAISFICTYCKI